MAEKEFIHITTDNAQEEGLFCVKNPKYPGFQLKLEWLKKRINEGLKFVILKNHGQVAGFIEYIAGEKAWRPVNAKGYNFIHCIWIYPKKNYDHGFGSALVNYCVEDSRADGKKGVVVQVSKGSWMAGPELFVKNGFQTIDKKDRFELLVNKFKKSANPVFLNWEANLDRYQGLHLIYANQCPLFIKSVDEMKKTAGDMGYKLNVSVLESSEQAQHAPSGYGVYSLVYNGKLLSDHYISNTRFKNILTKELA